MLGEGAPRRSSRTDAVRLTASAGKVCIESRATVGVTDAAVWEEGQCSVSRAKLLAALESYQNRSSISFTVNELGLRLGDVSLPVAHYVSQAPPPPPFQIFLASRSGTVSSQRPDPSLV